MRKAALITILTATALFVLFPLSLVIATLLESEKAVSGIAVVFHEVYFTVLPGALGVGFLIRYFDKLSSGEKSTFGKSGMVWTGVAVVGILLYIYAYAAGPGSILFRVDSIIPFLGGLAPNLQSFVLWTSFFIINSSVPFMFAAFARIGFDKAKFGALFIGFQAALAMSLFLVKIPVFPYLEESFVSLRFSWSFLFNLRNPGVSNVPGLAAPDGSPVKYCPAPADVSGQQLVVIPPNPPGIRDDIEIIGISNKTIEQVHGDWPLDWQYYADLTDKLSNAPSSILLFDISFLDEKGVFGGNYCGTRFECNPIGGRKMRRQVDILAESIARAKNTVVSDYPMETTTEARADIVNYDRRMQVLREKNRLIHVKNGGYAGVWARLPLPTVEPVARALKGLGYANIIKNEYGVNRQVPLVMRLMNMERAEKDDYNPDVDDEFYPGIDLLIVAKYYGVDPVENVEVDWLKGQVVIKNIPEKKKQKLNLQTGEMEEIDIMAKPTSDRSVVIPINRLGQMNINFRGGRYCFRYREFLETSQIDPGAAAGFNNKILLTAMYYATGVGTAKDMHLSPYGDMAGIEHHAYALNTLLNQDFAHDAPAWVNLIILLAVGLIMGFYQPRVPTGMSFLLLVAIAITYMAITLLVTFGIYSYIHVFPTVIIEQFVILIGYVGFRALTEEENVKFIRNTFSKFVSQDVVDELLANPEAIALGGSKKEITVFFSDVRGFTTISEALGPEELVHLLNEYLSEMTELIIDYRGTIDKYMGDAIMAFWGAPVKNDEHAYYACVAAIAQYRALQDLQKRWADRNVPALDIGIGVNSGQAVVGNMGSSRRMDFTAMGDTVNLGSRLEGASKQYGVKMIISEFTYERVKERVWARELDLVKVKGKTEPVRIYELMGLKDEGDLERLKRSYQAKTAQAS